MNETRAEHFENYTPDRVGRTFYDLSVPQRGELSDLVVQATQNFPDEERFRLVHEATGVTSLMYGMCMINLINDGTLQRGTLLIEKNEPSDFTA